MLQIRSKLEQSAVVWHSSLTKKNTSDLERVQKSALKLILKDRYINYKSALNVIGLESLEMRREKLCLKFAKACVRHKKLSDMFPKDKRDYAMDMRHKEKYQQKRARTERKDICSCTCLQFHLGTLDFHLNSHTRPPLSGQASHNSSSTDFL